MYRYNFFEAWPCRYMDPTTGRSTSRGRCVDGSCRDVGGNAYTFAGDNPWSYGDHGGGAGGSNREGSVHRDLAARNTLRAVTFGRDKLKGTTKTQGDFNLANRFSVEIDGVMVGGVHSIEGLENETDVVEYKDGEDGTMHTRPGNHKAGKMTVTKDWSNTSEWYKWRKAVLDGKVERKSVSVIFHNDAGEEAGRMNLFNCWPGWYTGPALNARSSAHASEKIEISYETMEWK
jgi:phage tail-like protein